MQHPLTEQQRAEARLKLERKRASLTEAIRALRRAQGVEEFENPCVSAPRSRTKAISVLTRPPGI